MNIFRYPEREKWPEILSRPKTDAGNLEAQVREIIDRVALQGDSAVLAYTEQFDKVRITSTEVPEEAIRKAAGQVSQELKQAIGEAYRNILTFHQMQVAGTKQVETAAGINCWQKPVPIHSVGLYIPGGSAPLFSTVLMLGIPARIAGCREVILCTPPGKDGHVDASILYVAGLLGIGKVFRIGGAQAVAAMAHGTETIPRVRKIFGPGNRYVTLAKQVLSRDTVSIDLPAGPSELAVIADASSNPAFVASDLLSQAEHGPDSQVLLFTDAGEMTGSVRTELERQLEMLPRKEIAQKALEHCKLILLHSQEEIMEMVNLYAPEHLIIATENYAELGGRVENAGSVFLGDYTPESAGDYASGTNHTLPTGGWAHAYSGVNLDSFYKKITFQEISKAGLRHIGDTVMAMAEAEQLTAHRNAVGIRLNEKMDENGR